MNILNNLIALILVLVFSVCAIFSQTKDFTLQNGDRDTLITPAPQYKAGSFHRFWFGDTWRNLWTTPIKVSFLNLDKYAGGLEIIKRGGGQQTRSLRFRGKDGRQYKFRSIQKFTDVYMPDELKNTLVDEAAKDIFSTTNPLAPVIASPIINTAGVYQAKPVPVVMPFDERLDEYYDDFAGLLGTIEEHPDDYDEEEINFANADNVFGTYKLYRKMLNSNKYLVDNIAFLKARLIDIYLGDWDRHFDQWRWAVFEDGEFRYCLPVPRDRDQAFCRYDGIIPFALVIAIPQIENAAEDYPQINDLTWSGRYLDRKFLSNIGRRQWDSTAKYLHGLLTDSLIESCISLLPPEVYEKEGARLRKVMYGRRDKFLEISEEYYLLLAKYCDVWASDKDEFCYVNRLSDTSLEVKIYDLKKDGTKRSLPFFHRIFDPRETSQVRILMHGGGDTVIVSGKVSVSPEVHVEGGSGKDYLLDSSCVDGFFFYPFSRKTYFYDKGDKSKLTGGFSTVIDRREYPEPEDDTAFFEPAVRDWGHDWMASPWFAVNSDDGLFFGGGPVLTKYDFKYSPYFYQMRFRLGYSVLLNGLRAEYTAHYTDVLLRGDFQLRLYGSAIDVSKFFGFGNETKMIDNPKSHYYRASLSNYSVTPSFRWELFENACFKTGAILEYAESNPSENTFLNETPVYGKKDMTFVSPYAAFNYDSRQYAENSDKGFTFDLEGTYSPIIFNNKNDFWMLSGEMRGYFTSFFVTKTTYAFRAGGQKLWGKAPFYKAPYLGGSENLRGYDRNRFAGDASLYGSAEARFHLFPYKFIVGGKIGGIAFADAGRVFLNGEDSAEIHYSAGGGIYATAYQDIYLVSLYLAFSPERAAVYFSSGFNF